MRNFGGGGGSYHPYFCVFKYARAVEQKVWNEKDARLTRPRFSRVRLTPRFTDFFTDFEKKKPTVLQSNSFRKQ